MIVLSRIACVLALSAAMLPAQTASLPLVQLFAPGVVSGPANDGSPTFSPNGKTLFFTRYAAHWSVILESRLVNGEWSEPVVAPFSGQWPDSSPAWSPDGKYIVFVSTRPKTPGQPIAGIVSNLWRVDSTPAGWSEPVRLPDEVNISGAIFKPSVAANGDVFITVIGPGAAKSIYVSLLRNGSYQRARLLPFSDGSKLDVDRDGVTLYFSSDRTEETHFPRTHEQADEDLKRLNRWDNSNSNVWTISLKGLV